MAEQIREKRATESRASFERPSKWAPASLLPDPEPEAGWAFRWIRLATLNNPDPSNISSKLREGWEGFHDGLRLEPNRSFCQDCRVNTAGSIPWLRAFFIIYAKDF